MEVSALGALIALTAAIVLIILRVSPAYSLIAGAFLGGMVGGVDPKMTIDLMISGAKDIVPATMRIITAGILAGVLIESGAAARIAETVIRVFGKSQALLALAVATMLLTAVGVFVDIAVITVSPIALALARSADCSRFVVLLAMVGGGKSGNVISPNPNTIGAAETFNIELSALMAANVVPALFGLAATVLTARWLHGRAQRKRETIGREEPGRGLDAPVSPAPDETLPAFTAAILGPVVTIALLSLRPISKLFQFEVYEIDPMVALPAGGIVGCFAMGKARQLNAYMVAGLQRMTGVAILLLGTGTLAGIIKGSALSGEFVKLLDRLGLEPFLLAPISGMFMSAATASTTAGTVVASESFGATLLASGVSALAAAAMIHAGATFLDHLPHGSFFHATGGAVGMKFGERLRLIPFESAVGLVLVLVSTLIHGVFIRAT